MKRAVLFFLFFIAVFFIVQPAFSQNPLVKQWDKRFGGTSSDGLVSFQQTNDGGYILGGWSSSYISGDKTQDIWGLNDYWIVKTNSFGMKLWDKDFGGTESDELTCMQQTKEGGYILGGYSFSGIGGSKTQNTWGYSDYWIVKVDSMGNKEWDKDFGGNDFDMLTSIQQTFDGGFILGGYSSSGISGDKTQDTIGGIDYWIVKTDSLGNKQWDKDFGGTGNDVFYSLKQTTDEGYILGGWSSSNISGDKTQSNWDTSGMTADYWIVKIDSLGDISSDKTFGGTSEDNFYALQQTADGGYILSGNSISDSSGDKTQPCWGSSDYWIVKIDAIGTKLWDKRFGGTSAEELVNVSQLPDEGYLIAGDSYSPLGGDKTENNFGQEQTWVLKTDSLGNKQWDNTLITTGHDENGLAIQTNDGCYVIANHTNAGIGGDKTQLSQGIYDYWIIKFCDSTATTGISNFQIPNSSFQIFPNPVNELLVIRYPLIGKKEIIIYDLFGRTVFESSTVNGQSSMVNGHSSTSIDVSKLSPGIYLIKARNDVRKFVKE